MEKVDTYTADKKQKQQAILRTEIGTDDWLLAVHLWIFNSNGQFLLQRRAATKKSSPLKWDISVAGHIMSGENAEETIIREAQEELGIMISKSSLEWVRTFSYAPHKTHIETYKVVQDIDLTTVSLQADEVAEVQWMDSNQLSCGIFENPDDFVIRDNEFELVLTQMKNRPTLEFLRS